MACSQSLCMHTTCRSRLGHDYSHDGHEVTCQSCRASRTAHHDPELRKHRDSTDEKTTQPRDIADHLIVHVSTKQAGKNKRSKCHGKNWKSIVLCFVCVTLSRENTIKEP